MVQIAYKTGLFFGSFNPVHVGHMVLANYMAEFTDLDEIWFIVSTILKVHSVRGIVAQWVGTNPPLTVCALSARRALSFVAGRIPFLCSLIHAFSLPFSLLLSPLVSVHATEQNTVENYRY